MTFEREKSFELAEGKSISISELPQRYPGEVRLWDPSASAYVWRSPTTAEECLTAGSLELYSPADLAIVLAAWPGGGE